MTRSGLAEALVEFYYPALIILRFGAVCACHMCLGPYVPRMCPVHMCPYVSNRMCPRVCPRMCQRICASVCASLRLVVCAGLCVGSTSGGNALFADWSIKVPILFCMGLTQRTTTFFESVGSVTSFESSAS